MEESMSRRLFALAATCLLALATFGAAPAAAQNWPQRPVKFIVSLGPGSGADIGARLLADRLTKKWGQPVVIENRPGGDGIIAINAFVSAKDDHVLLFSPSSAFIHHPYQHDNLPYKPADLATIARVSNTVITISVPSDFPAKTMKDIVDMARAKPADLNWAGTTGALDILFEGWLKLSSLEMKKVPYRNAVEAANDLAAGRVQVYQSAYAIVRPQIEAGKVKMVAVTNSARASMIPNVPTVTESGHPALTLDGLIGLFGPPSMPMALRERIAADMKDVMESDAIIKDRLVVTAQVPNPGGPEEFARSIQNQRDILAKAAKDLGIKSKQ
jgi:tripartite-type tricarboxylate transporter receptor subunit TctC